MLEISKLFIAIEDADTAHKKEIVRGVSLTVNPGEVHAIMGPNGSGKSTLASTIAGHPTYSVQSGSVTLDGKDILELSPDERAQKGLFLAFQYPVEVPGVRVQNVLRLAHSARFNDQPEKIFPKAIDFRKHLEKLASDLNVKKEFLTRGLNEGFSGGEKKRLEVLQMACMEPKYAILDESDSGLDIDAVKAVAAGIKYVNETYQTGMVIITHYKRILEYIKPDFVHLMVDGKIVETGDATLADKLEKQGYKAWQTDETLPVSE